MTARVEVAQPLTDRRAFPITATVLIGIAGLAAWWTVAHANGMNCMLDGLARAGRAMPFHSGPAHFAGTWTVMMAAMMVPGIVAVAGRYPSVAGIATAAGYLAVWTATAVFAFGALIVLNAVEQPSGWLNRAGGMVIALAGVYQLTGWKRRLLARYAIRDQTPTAAGAFAIGVSHGLRCLASSCVLMSVLLVVGVMNIVWMVAIGAICLGEKASSRHVGLATAVGLVLIAIGCVVALAPQTLSAIAET